MYHVVLILLLNLSHSRQIDPAAQAALDAMNARAARRKAADEAATAAGSSVNRGRAGAL